MDDLVARLDEKIVTGPGCWKWLNKLQPNGYAALSFKGKHHYVHRVVYSLLVGDIPEGLVIDHLCRNRGCVNPAHLEAVTQKENLRRGNGVGQGGVRFQKSKTHCPSGHPLSGTNLYIQRGNGGRKCKKCMAGHTRAYRLRKLNEKA